jgi:hypothetical protein
MNKQQPFNLQATSEPQKRFLDEVKREQKIENVPPAVLRERKRWRDMTNQKIPMPPLPLRCSADYDLYAQVALLRKDGSTQSLSACQLSHDTSMSEWESLWIIEEHAFLPLGLPVFAYSGKCSEESEPLCTTFTEGEKGLLLRFAGSNHETFEALKQPDLWFFIQEIE